MPAKILVVDDDEELLQALRKVLTQEGYSVVVAANGSDGRIMAVDSRPDLVLADAEMPGMDGHSLCRALKQDDRTKALPVILMSGSMTSDKDVVSGLEGGADDYVAKPFRMQVLLARVQAVLRRFQSTTTPQARLQSGDLELDLEARECRIAGRAVSLSRKEFDLLALLMDKPGRVVTTSFLLESVWGYDLASYNDTHTVETHVSRLRKKVGSNRIVNLPGIGYKFSA